MKERQIHHDEDPCFVISVAARMVGMHAQSLRNYERMELIQPGRSGAGAVSRPKRLDVKIPAGAQTGLACGFAGEGSPGQGGGPRGDLYVVTKVRPHSKFERKGDDLLEEVAVPVEDAVLGGEVEVPTIAGKRVAMKVPAMTQSGRQIKLKGLGMPNLNGKDKGDLLARVKVVIPDEVSEDERALFEELREMRSNGHKRKS